MVSDQAVSGCATPHEGRCQLALSPSIVGLMRNSLSEAPHTIGMSLGLGTSLGLGMPLGV